MGSRRKDRELHWLGVLEQQAESGLSVASFCRQQSISAPSFHAWRRKLKERDVEARQGNRQPGAKAISAAGLLPVRIESSAPATSVRILLPQGVAIDIPSSINHSALSNLLRALGEAHRC